MRFSAFSGCRGATSVPRASPSGVLHHHWCVEIGSLEELLDLVEHYGGLRLYPAPPGGRAERFGIVRHTSVYNVSMDYRE
jgi:hypothetical protein